MNDQQGWQHIKVYRFCSSKTFGQFLIRHRRIPATAHVPRDADRCFTATVSRASQRHCYKFRSVNLVIRYRFRSGALHFL